jgi:hypothetical protein
VEIKLTLTLEEVQALMNLMGETPAKMGFFPLMAKVKIQADPQVPKEEKEAEQAVA